MPDRAQVVPGPAELPAGAGAAAAGGASPWSDPQTKAIEQAKSDAKGLLTKALEDLKKGDKATKTRAKKWFGDDK